MSIRCGYSEEMPIRLRILTLSCVAFAAALGEDWPAFRNTARDGAYTGQILTSWPTSGLKQAWRIQIGDGYAGVSIAAGKVFTIEQRKDNEAATAYDLASGKALWANTWRSNFTSFLGGNGPRSTPTFDDGLLYVQGAQGEFRCLDAATGRVVWAKNVLAENGAKEVGYGQAMSPLVFEDKVIVLVGGPGGKSVIAYNKKTGSRIWSVLDDAQAYMSPMLATLAGAQQLLAVTVKRIVGLDPNTGALLWSHAWETSYDVNSTQPVITGPNRFVIAAGYGHGAAAFEIAKNGAQFAVKMLWSNKNLKAKFNSPVVHQGFVYGLDEGILTCIDAATGERKWKSGRYGYGQVLLASGHLIVTAESGEVLLIKADPAALKEVAKFQALYGKTWNTPAIGDGWLVVRNEKELASFRIAP